MSMSFLFYYVIKFVAGTSGALSFILFLIHLIWCGEKKGNLMMSTFIDDDDVCVRASLLFWLFFFCF